MCGPAAPAPTEEPPAPTESRRRPSKHRRKRPRPNPRRCHRWQAAAATIRECGWGTGGSDYGSFDGSGQEPPPMDVAPGSGNPADAMTGNGTDEAAQYEEYKRQELQRQQYEEQARRQYEEQRRYQEDAAKAAAAGAEQSWRQLSEWTAAPPARSPPHHRPLSHLPCCPMRRPMRRWRRLPPGFPQPSTTMRSRSCATPPSMRPTTSWPARR